SPSEMDFLQRRLQRSAPKIVPAEERASLCREEKSTRSFDRSAWISIPLSPLTFRGKAVFRKASGVECRVFERLRPCFHGLQAEPRGSTALRPDEVRSNKPQRYGFVGPSSEYI